MEKFLEHHNLTKSHNYMGDCYLVQVEDQCGNEIDELYCYCIFDVLRVTRYYLAPDGRFWYTIKVTKV